jgi:hypothetical protein
VLLVRAVPLPRHESLGHQLDNVTPAEARKQQVID